MSSLIHVLNKNSLARLLDYFCDQDLFKADLIELETASSTTDDETEALLKRETLISKQVWMLNQLSSIAKNKCAYENDKLDIVEKILSYLMVNSYFEVESSKLLKNDRLAENLHDRLIELIGMLLSAPNMSRLKEIVKLVETFEKILDTSKLSDRYEKKRDDVKLIVARISKLLRKIVENVKALPVVVKNEGKVAAAADENENLFIFQTFFMVVSVEFFRVFDSIKSSKQVIDDVEICLKNFLEELSAENGQPAKKKSKKNGKLAFWVAKYLFCFIILKF